MEIQNSKTYDLEERTFGFAKDCRALIKLVPRTISNIEDCKQLARYSGSQAANYIEANESLSRKDYYHRVRICRKEAKESRLWLRLIDIGEKEELQQIAKKLVQETIELTKIFGKILENEKK